VHQVLGRHRGDDGREGWLSPSASDQHPTRGGLRIGKPRPERAEGEPPDEELEWEQDGQYLHYLTRWMVALDQLARFSREPTFNLWGRELAQTAYDAFARSGRLVWKMSIDLSRPLVTSTGQHDAVDAYITCVQLQATARELAVTSGPNLEAVVSGLGAMLEQAHWTTGDPLGLGGLLTDAYRVEQLMRRGGVEASRLRAPRHAAAEAGLRRLRWSPGAPASTRLAFRELGLSIGLHAVERMAHPPPRLGELLPLATRVEDFWRARDHQLVPSWIDHQDINAVMLATSLLPDGWLDLVPLGG